MVAAGSATAALSAAVVVIDHSAVLLLLLSLLALALGVHRLVRAILHRVDPDYRVGDMLPRLTLHDLLLAIGWVAVGLLLTASCVMGLPPLAVAVAGVVLLTPIVPVALALTADIARFQDEAGAGGARAFLAGTDRARRWLERSERAEELAGARELPVVFARREPLDQMTRHTARVLTTFLCVTVAYVGVVGANVVTVLVDEAEPATITEQVAHGPFTYEQLCPQLPDPLTIGHGLGELFTSVGAVQAGCGGLERRVAVDVPVWVSDGVCEGQLRSIGIAFPGGAVLLFGQAARMARERADEGTLRYAERGFLGGGEVIVVGTVAGTWVLARTTPALRRGRRRPLRCEEVDEVARPFTVLRPALAALWVQHVRVHGWTWPVPDASRGPGAVALLDPDTRQVLAHGDCTSAAACEIVGAKESWRLEGPATTSMDSLVPYAP